MKDREKVKSTWEGYWDSINKLKIGSYSDYLWNSHLSYFKKYINFRGKKVLEVGVGGGELLSRIGLLGAKVYGIDISKSAVKLAKKRLEDLGIKGDIVRSDALDLPFKGGIFDFTYCLGLIEHFPSDMQKRQIIKQLSQVTKKEGIVIITVPNRGSVYTPKKLFDKLIGRWEFGYEEEFLPDELYQLVRPYLRNLEFAGIDIHPSLFRLIPSVGPIRGIDSRIIIPLIKRIERKYPNLTLKIAHMICVKGHPK